jgi:hypothetical protein
MSDFMLSQVQGLLTRVVDDLDRLNLTSQAQAQTLIGAVDDLAANMFATQAILAMVLKNNPVDAQAAKDWIIRQTGGAEKTPKAMEAIDQLLAQK